MLGAPAIRARPARLRHLAISQLFEDLSVYENLEVATGRQRWREAAGGIRAAAVAELAADKALAAVGLGALATRFPGELSLGQRKLVGVARALASSPGVVCQTSQQRGWTARESTVLGTQLRAVVEQGLALLLVDHDMGLVLSVCDYIYVLDFGKARSRAARLQISAGTYRSLRRI